VLGRKGEHKKVFEDARKAGYVRVRVDGDARQLDETFNLDKQVKHTIEVIVDRVVLRDEARSRLADSIEAAISMTDGLVRIAVAGEDGTLVEETYSEHNSCPVCGISIPALEPRLFSFNNPFGACPSCHGLGFKTEFDPDKIIPDRNKSYAQGAIATQNPEAGWSKAPFLALAKRYGFDLDTPFNKLSEEVINIILYGSQEKLPIRYENEKTHGSGCGWIHS
jgi:excinuclease ABC subunit A